MIQWTKAELNAWMPPDGITTSEWADKYRLLDNRNSKEPGKWHTERTPYLKAIMDAFCDDEVEEIIVCAGAQLGKSEAILNMLGYAIHQNPGPAMLVYPTQDIAESISRNRLQIMVETTPALRERKTQVAADFQLTEMKFQTMTLFLAWANSPAMLASKPIRYLFMDEIDKYPSFSGREADPISLAKKRTTSYTGFHKIVYVSTPTFETGNIWYQLSKANVIYRYYVPCPFCGEYQLLEFENIKWERDDDFESLRQNAYYECAHCHARIKSEHKMAMLQKGEWREDERKHFGRRKVGFHISAIYSPFFTFGDLAREFLESKNDVATLMDFTNSRLALPFKEVVEKSRESDVFAHVSTLPVGVAPDDTVAIVAGIDTQDDGFFYTIYAIESGNIPHLLRYGFVGTLNELDGVIFNSVYRINNSDINVRVARAFIDSGGHRTAEIYDYARTRRGFVYPIKGMNTPSAGVAIKETAIEKYPNSNAPIPGGLRLVNINTIFYKDEIHRRLLSDKGEIWFHASTASDFAMQLTAEEKRRSRKGQSYSEDWVRVYSENHYLDCTVYALAAAEHLQARFLPKIKQDTIQSAAVTTAQTTTRTQSGSWIPKPKRWL